MANFESGVKGYVTGQYLVNVNFPIDFKDNVEKAEPKWVEDKWGWWYDNGDGTYPKSKWLELSGVWYYFDDEGYAYRNKWLLYKNEWYYFDNDCKMVTSKWIFYKDKWYYIKENGVMATNCEVDGWIIDANGVGTKKE